MRQMDTNFKSQTSDWIPIVGYLIKVKGGPCDYYKFIVKLDKWNQKQTIFKDISTSKDYND